MHGASAFFDFSLLRWCPSSNVPVHTHFIYSIRVFIFWFHLFLYSGATCSTSLLLLASLAFITPTVTSSDHTSPENILIVRFLDFESSVFFLSSHPRSFFLHIRVPALVASVSLVFGLVLSFCKLHSFLDFPVNGASDRINLLSFFIFSIGHTSKSLQRRCRIRCRWSRG